MKFADMTQGFMPNDTLKIKLIRETLGLLNRDYEEISFSEIIIRGDSLFYTITSTQNYSKANLISKDRYLEKSTENWINYIDSQKQIDLKTLFQMSDSKSRLEVMIRISNGYYLLLTQYRR